MSSVLELLQKVPDLAGVPLDELEWLAEKGRCQRYHQGDQLFRRGDPIDNLLVVLEGGFVLKIEQGGQYRIVGEVGALEITGLLPYSRATTANGFSEAVADSQILMLHRDHFREMIREKEHLTTALVHTMSTRIRNFTKRQQQNEKMMALGKLSAGLAHELNNPSSAVVRSAQNLKKHLGLLPEDFKKVIRIRATDEEVDRVNNLIFERISQSGAVQLSLMERTEKEDELSDWLDDHHFHKGLEASEVLAEFGFGEDDLEELSSFLRPEDVNPVINWITQVLTTEKLINEIEEASQRISQLVTSVKGYTHMDQAPEKQSTDVHKGLRDTLTMLKHKIKKGGIEVVEDFAEGLPHPEVFVSEINQVWTNLIDNAIDAMSDSDVKQLTLSTHSNGAYLNVEISDSGSGIPEEVLPRIFEPFYTTKPIGKGTGLGLEIVHQIVTQHHGQIDVSSEPGKTTFKVTLPINTSQS